MDGKCMVCKSTLTKMRLTAGLRMNKDNTYHGVSLKYYLCKQCGYHSPPADTFEESWDLWKRKLTAKGMIT